MNKLRVYLSVAAFGFLGGICRYFLSGIYHAIGTVICNLLGCFLLSFLTYFVIESKKLPEWLNTGLGTGFIGAFTTFSSFELDSLKFINANQGVVAITYFLISIIFGFLFALLGMKVGILLGKKGINK
ncbi:CrcB family protein [Lactobacillus mulieris]|uniref:fluoride efflux transporter FluC n=1 Tax=Lactobacillus mulieris TaxID=2508708 RepID=UPI0014331510|nr:CrcB family protein [Lactobacillus mulieris]MCF1783581.1 CrcB family protein [Lactobacillus mulieris]MCW8104167.1 CrcB family protein [Lactobacillus mulieris]MDK6802776.1 CrcB family protein [Lactobacillus mulieris]MDK8381892.1 CrcB family protein [Lactobacillus mulieris]MDT9620101.1 CrcB family protein [Lactobacillus mulieris]